jgi:Toxin SymE, type I toxin-antitoxin system
VAERRLTVSRRYRGRVLRPWERSCEAEPFVPFVRLSGRWFAELGFATGAKVWVRAEPGRLVLTTAPAAEVAEAAGGEG